jgi:hypothetical protein
MGFLWSFVAKPKNRQLLTWAGSGAVVFAGGLWAIVTYVWPAHQQARIVCAQQGSVGGGRDASGNTITYSGTAPAGAGTPATSCGDTKE